jgi:GT2 family glycosyltransferase
MTPKMTGCESLLEVEISQWGLETPMVGGVPPPDVLGRWRRRLQEDCKALAAQISHVDRTVNEARLSLRLIEVYENSKKFQHLRPHVKLRAKADRTFAAAVRRGEVAPGVRPRMTHFLSPETLDLCLWQARCVLVGEQRQRSRTLDAIGPGVTFRYKAGEGSGAPSSSGIEGRYRPEPQSFVGWMSLSTTAERTQIQYYVLGPSANSLDARCLASRLHRGQRIVGEAGSEAVAQLLEVWEGPVLFDGSRYLFTLPGPRFLAPGPEDETMPDGRPWPKISVVTTNFNQACFLEDCLLSILDQSYPNLEYIVIDACSTDGSLEILERYRSRLSKLVIEPDGGQSDGINKGFRYASGDVLTWINSDDMLAPQALRKAALSYEETGCDLIAGSCLRIGAAGERLFCGHAALPTLRPVNFAPGNVLGWTTSGWEHGDFFYQPEVFFTRDLWLRTGASLKKHLYWAMDVDFWNRCALAGSRIVRIPEILGVSRHHSEQKTTDLKLYIPQLLNIAREFDCLLAEIEEIVSVKYCDCEA